MLNKNDQLRARFAPNDPVGLIRRGRLLEGVLVRANPTRAVVRIDHEDYHVPYAKLVALGDAAPVHEQQVAGTLQLAKDLIIEHGLDQWRFAFDHSTRRAGCCNYHDKLISMSFELARNGSAEDIRDTILHEIAHALVGEKHNHDAAWKAKAKEIGCSGERTHRLVFSPPRYHVTCVNRCWKQTAERRQRRLVCRTCGGKLVYSPYIATT
ncbi:MAG: SprT-like domain-containing protein [Kiritimatiellales bacterium]|nr:SprT-like domain-containing protein [Kiritimatiellales bacterium]MCF7864523.1 SprT-like domain-containing protein [Kiritimatiellales bacterium]